VQETNKKEEQTNMTETKSLESWGDFCGSNFLKAEQVKNEQEGYVVTDIEVFSDENNSAKPRLSLEKGEETFLFDLNVTNSNFCKNNGITSPKQLIGKKLYFRKVNVMSPTKKKEVESLRISKIE
jgi:hypothetical protein